MINELFTNDLNRLTLFISVRGTATAPTALPIAKIYVSSTNTFTGTGTDLTVVDDTTVTGKFTVDVPNSILTGYRYAKVVYEYSLASFGAQVKEEIFNISARLLSFEEYNWSRGKDVKGVSKGITYERYMQAESDARATIENYTNQFFGRWTGTISVISAPNRIFLPYILEELTDISEAIDSTGTLATQYTVEDTGWSLFRSPELPLRSKSKRYYITGKWGYSSIPDGVKKAAKELIHDYASDNFDARRGYLLNTSGGTDLANQSANFDQISWKAYSTQTTGNAVADSYLEPFRTYNPRVI